MLDERAYCRVGVVVIIHNDKNGDIRKNLKC